MSRAALVARGRAAALAGMVDTCTIQHQTGSSTDQDTGVDTPTYSTVYSGQCRFQVSAPSASETDVGEAQVYVSQTILQLPMTVVGVENEDLVTCTASALDPDLPGRAFRVKGVLRKTHSTSRRIQLQEVD
jgi:Family of unknown function (DUF6093)